LVFNIKFAVAALVAHFIGLPQQRRVTRIFATTPPIPAVMQSAIRRKYGGE